MKYYKAGHSGTTGHFEHVKGSSGAIYTMEQQYLQGDTEAIFAKRMIYVFESDTDSHFTDVDAQFAAEVENLTGLTYQKFLIRYIKALNDEAHDCYLHISAQDDFANADPDLDDLIATLSLAFTSALKYENGGLLRVCLGGGNDLYVPYEDEDGTYEFHCAWEDLNAAGKGGGADAVKIKVWVEVVA